MAVLFTGCDKDSGSFYWGYAVEGYPITAEKIEELKNDTGLFPGLLAFYLQWPLSPNSFEISVRSFEEIWKAGSVPCLTWEPMYYREGKEVMIPYEEILNGSYDDYITAFATALKGWGKPCILRFAHEMNLDRYHWGTTLEEFGPDSPQIYIEIFQHVVGQFRKKGVKNVLWAFCPNAVSVPGSTAWNKPKNYYPGDQYVDLLGMDGYNCISAEKDQECPLRSFEQIFAPLYQELKKIAPKKPILVFETASINREETRLPWIMDAIPVIKKWRLKGVIWFQANKEQDWRINSGEDYSYVPIILPKAPSISAQEWAKSLLRQ